MENKDNCPVEATLDLIGGKYKALILWHLSDEKLRFSQLRQRITSQGVQRRNGHESALGLHR